MLLQQSIDVLNLDARATRDALLAGTVDDIGETALVRRHGADHRFHPVEVLLIDRFGSLSHLPHTRKLVEHSGHAAHVLHLLELISEVLEIKTLALLNLASELVGLLLVELALCFLDKGEHITHSEDTRGHALGMEGLERIDLLAHAEKLDRPPRYLTNGKRCTATGVAIGLREHNAGQRQCISERAGRVRRVLAGHGVDDKQCFRRSNRGVHAPDLVHELFVDGEPACRVDDEYVLDPLLRAVNGSLGDLHRILRRIRRKAVDAHLLRQTLELIDCGGPSHVRGHHQNLLFLTLLEVFRELGDRGRLARALQARKQDHRGRAHREFEARVRVSHDVD